MRKVTFTGFPDEELLIRLTQYGEVVQQSVNTPIGSAPSLSNDSAVVTENQSVLIDVLANDTPEGGEITAKQVVSGGGSVDITGGQQLQFDAPAGAGTSVLSYTVENEHGSETAEVTVTVVPSPTQTVVLSANRTTGTSPAGFFFSASAEESDFDVEDAYFDLRYKWTFSDPGYYTRHDSTDLPWGKYYDVDGLPVLVEDGSTPANGTFLGNDKNVAYGPHVAHVFDTPGIYTVTCEVQKRGQASVWQTMQIVVEDPDAVFAGTNTVCVSTAGNFTGAPAGATQVTSYAAAMTAIESGPEKRVLFRRGEAVGNTSAPSRSGGFDKLQFGAFGSGTPPTYSSGIRLEINADGETCLWGLDYSGPYDPTNPGSEPNTDGTTLVKNGFKTVWDMSFRGGNKLIWVNEVDTENVVIGNVYGTEWHDYGIFAERNLGNFGCCGVFMKQNVDTLIGPVKRGDAPAYQDHAPFRCSALIGPVCFNLMDLRSVGSWSGYFQPCLRVGRSPSYAGLNPEEASMDRIRAENGACLGTGNSGSDAYARKYVFDKVYNILMPDSRDTFCGPGVSGMHYRNIVMVIPNTPKLIGNLRYWVERTAPNNPDNNVDAANIGEYGVTLMNSTMIDLRSDFTMSFDVDSMSDFAFFREENNVVYTPNKSDPTSTSSEPLDLTKMFEWTYPGVREVGEDFNSRFDITGARGGSAFYTPQSGSNAYKTASGDYIAVDDFFGRVRDADTSKGAMG